MWILRSYTMQALSLAEPDPYAGGGGGGGGGGGERVW